MTRLLNKAEVAALLHVSLRTVDRLRAAGQLHSLKVRGAVRFAPEAVATYVQRQRGGRP